MRALRRAAGVGSLLLCVLASGPAQARTCWLTGTGDWGPVGSYTGTDNCGGAPTASDSFVVAGDVTVVDDVLLDPAGRFIRVEAGGTLQAAVTGHALELRVGSDAIGLTCKVGSTCRFEGAYREFGTPSPGLQPARGPDTVWTAGEVVPCVDADCAADADRVRLRWPDPGALASIAQVVPGRDVACFFDPDPADLEVSSEVNQCYEITAAGQAGGFAYLDLDVRQGERDQHGYPLQRREIQETRLTEDLATGDRWVQVEPGLLASGEDGRWVGRWIRFEDAAGAPGSRPYKILRSLDCEADGDVPPECGGSAGDRLRIGDLRGVGSGHDGSQAPERLWLGYGFEPGDPFAVLAPVRITSSTPEARDGAVHLEGSSLARGVVFDDLRGVRVKNGGVLDLSDFWIQDATDVGGHRLTINDSVGSSIRTGCLTGGDDDAGGTCQYVYGCVDRTHGITGGGNVGLEISDVSMRHHGDDAIVFSQGVETNLSIRRFHAAFHSDNAQSCNCISLTNQAHQNVLIEDVVCDDATDEDANWMSPDPGGDATVSGFLVWGGIGSGVPPLPAGTTSVSDWMMLGTQPALAWPLLPESVDGFVVREVAVQAMGSIANALTSDARNGIVREVVVGGKTGWFWPDDGEIENVAVVDLDTSDSCASGAACIAVKATPTVGVTVRDVTLAWRPGVVPAWAFALRVGGADPLAGNLLDGLLTTGFVSPSGAWFGAGPDVAATFDASKSFDGPCFHANSADGTAAVLANLPPSTVSGLAPGYVDLDGYRVDTLPGSVAESSGCGIRRGVDAPGISRFRWMHAVSGLAPERMADDADGDGVVEDAQAASCSAGASSACSDNCPGVFDPTQADADGDGVGDLCDAPCADGLDNDGDGFTDHPADPGCRDATWLEDPRCQDGVDNDVATGTDFDGGESVLGAGNGDPAGADPQCSAAWKNLERGGSACGMGFELAPLLGLLAALGIRRRPSLS